MFSRFLLLNEQIYKAKIIMIRFKQLLKIHICFYVLPVVKYQIKTCKYYMFCHFSSIKWNLVVLSLPIIQNRTDGQQNFVMLKQYYLKLFILRLFLSHLKGERNKCFHFTAVVFIFLYSIAKLRPEQFKNDTFLAQPECFAFNYRMLLL